MASAQERRRNNVRAGVFVTISLFAVLAVVITISNAGGALLRQTTMYTVAYAVQDGIKYLNVGSDVRIGGVSMGSVEAVRPLTDGDSFEVIEVDFELENVVELYMDSKIAIGTPLLGSEAWLDVTSVGTREAGSAVDQIIPGHVPSGMLAQLLGPRGADNAQATIANAREFSENAVEFSENVQEMPDEMRERVYPILDDAKSTTANLDELVKEFRADTWPGWIKAVDEVMTWAGEFTAELDLAVADARAFIDNTDGVITDNREDIRTLVTNTKNASATLDEVAEQIQSETMAKVNRLLDSGQQGLEDARAVVTRVRSDYEGWEARWADTLADLSLTAQQLKLASIEVRRSPWRLLYRPGTTELEHEMLYEATRSFAIAAADLKAAAASADRMLSLHGDELARDPELLERVSRNLSDPLEKYERAQQRLFDVLLVEESQ